MHNLVEEEIAELLHKIAELRKADVSGRAELRATAEEESLRLYTEAAAELATARKNRHDARAAEREAKRPKKPKVTNTTP